MDTTTLLIIILVILLLGGGGGDGRGRWYLSQLIAGWHGLALARPDKRLVRRA